MPRTKLLGESETPSLPPCLPALEPPSRNIPAKGNGFSHAVRKETPRTAGILGLLLFAYPTISFQGCFKESRLVLLGSQHVFSGVPSEDGGVVSSLCSDAPCPVSRPQTLGATALGLSFPTALTCPQGSQDRQQRQHWGSRGLHDAGPRPPVPPTPTLPVGEVTFTALAGSTSLRSASERYRLSEDRTPSP